MTHRLPKYPARAPILFACLAILLAQRPSLAVPPDVILRAADATIVGSAWAVVADATAAGGSRLGNADAGAAIRPREPTSPAQ